ncbi:MAG: helix-turn-helix domain-containing protein [Gammaproteobacteria bacterium]|nr:helix-turn-helix domain-containing protein [Gammaproteobacteria bacterium]
MALVSSHSQFRYSIGMLLLPGFNSASAFTFLDPFRAANYIQNQKPYHWDFLSLKGGEVNASNESTISATHTISSGQKHYDLIVVNASWAPERFQSGKLKRWLHASSKAGATLAAIDTGAFVLAYSGLLKHYCATVHYEHTTAFSELFPDTQLEDVLYVIDRDRLSCGGGLATADMALRLIQNHQGLELTNSVAKYILKDRHRVGNEIQAEHNPELIGYPMPQKLREAIVLMEQNLEEPLSTSEIAALTHYSQRQLARIFKQHIGITPIRYYINLRLDRARGLITQTDMLIAEVANACGFGTSEQFSRAYKSHFNITPGKDRIEGRIPFQFRSFPSHAGMTSQIGNETI